VAGDRPGSFALPDYYAYAQTLLRYLQARRADFKPFDGNPVLPRQLEVHVPNDGPQPCNLHCKHCQGNRVDQPMAKFDDTLLQLIEDLAGRVSLFVFSGAYVEPTLNRHLIEFIEVAKATNSQFGLHTHGGLLKSLDRELSFVSRICGAADGSDYVTVSLDAGCGDSYAKTKRVDPTHFDAVVDGLDLLVRTRESLDRPGPRIRVTYLLNKWNSGRDEIVHAAEIARRLRVDSLRFSIPYAPYGTPYDASIRYKQHHEVSFYAEVVDRLAGVLSENPDDRPFVSFLPPDAQDVENCFTHHCAYGYFQITTGSDGYLYRCSSTASPSFPEHRLGRLPATADQLVELVGRNQDGAFDPMTRCKPCGARCNRAAIDVNQTFEARWYGGDVE
jgi:MoaA/NifB/PqqE/SkfB family radical SAM enzyme